MSVDGNSILYKRVRAILPKREIRTFAGTLTEQVADGKPFTCLITDDRELTRLNNLFLGHDYPTDVLSFPSEDGAALGDIAISAERAEAQAKEHGHSTVDEIRILMLHGVLHLMGMDHEKDRGTMARAEKRWRVTLGLPGGLIERSKRKAS